MPMTIVTDMPDVVVVTQPGIGLAGQVVFADGPPASPPKMRIAFRRPETLPPSSREIVATMDDDFRFYGSDVFGPQLVRVTELPAGWAVKAVTLAGTDITDVRQSSNRSTTASCRSCSRRRPRRWKVWSAARTRRRPVTRPSTCSVRIAARGACRRPARTRARLPRRQVQCRRAGGWPLLRDRRGSRGISSGRESREAFFELLSKEATPFVIGDDERRTLELRLWRWPE